LERTTGFEPRPSPWQINESQFYYLHLYEYRPHSLRFQLTIVDRDLPLLTVVCAFFVVHAPQDSAPHVPRLDDRTPVCAPRAHAVATRIWMASGAPYRPSGRSIRARWPSTAARASSIRSSVTPSNLSWPSSSTCRRGRACEVTAGANQPVEGGGRKGANPVCTVPRAAYAW
jgi:hypothetical protein